MAEKPKPEKKDPVYVVCAVDAGDRLTVLEEVPAKTQEKAMDAVSERLPADHHGTGRQPGSYALAAFLAGSLRVKEYRKTQTVITEGTLTTLESAGAKPQTHAAE